MSTSSQSDATRVEADMDRCEGHGLCASVAPDHFELDNDGFLHIRDHSVTLEQLQRVEDAIRSCPVAALSLHR